MLVIAKFIKMRIKKQILVVLLVFLLLYLIHVYVSHNREQHESTRSASTPDWSAVLPNRTERCVLTPENIQCYVCELEFGNI